jgi:trimeric autotransporter adhesin
MPITTEPTVATGDTITAAQKNTARDNILVLDGRTGGDPGGSAKWLESSSTTAGSWVARLTALANAFASGPVSSGLTLAGAVAGVTNLTMSGALSAASAALSGALSAASAAISGNATVGGTMGVTGTSTLGDVSMSAGKKIQFAQENAVKVNLTADGQYSSEVQTARHILNTNRHLSIHNAAASAGDYSFTLDTTTHAAAFQGAVAAASAALTGALSAASAAISGAITAVTTLTASGLVTALRFQATQATGTAPLTVASTTRVTNLNADTAGTADTANQLGGVAAANYARKDAASNFTTVPQINGVDVMRHQVGTYTGNATNRIVVLGWTPKSVIITWVGASNAGTELLNSGDSNDAGSIVLATSAGSFVGGQATGDRPLSSGGNGFALAAGSWANQSGVTYYYTAIG